jgi:CDP-glycerol glycerophosphotransferase (TagB/SpsB family)
MDRLKAVSKSFQSPIASEAATEVAAFGQFSVPQVRLDAVRSFVPAAEVAAEIKAFKALASSNKVTLKGLEKPIVEDFGVYKRYAYNVTSTADFADLLNFFNVFAESPLRIGVPKTDIKFAKKNPQTAMRIEMFVLR